MSPSNHKRKASSPASSIDDDVPEEPRRAGSGSELVPSTKAGEPPVTKRTLQNRKAQREFRKRREARVKDLEERCRRFDQMGLEANTELQNMTRRFKEENEALKALLVRLGYGNMIAGALEGISEGAQEDINGEASSEGGHFPDEPSTVPLPKQMQYPHLEPPPGSVNPGMLEPSGVPTYIPHGDAMTVRWANEERSTQWKETDANRQQSQMEQPQSSRRMSGTRSGEDAASGLLSLKFEGVPGKTQSAASRHPQQTQQIEQTHQQQHYQHHPQVANSSAGDGITPGTLSSLIGFLGGQSNNGQHDLQSSRNQSTGGGSSFLKNMNGPAQSSGAYGMAHRPHQNDALLNPNPIPFAVNLSNEPAPEQSWWDRHGGGMFGSENFLDEKANLVAQVSAGQGNAGSLSPFDISAFLTSGHTPGAGFNFSSSNMPTGFTPALTSSNDPLSQAGSEIKNGKEPASGSSSQKQQHTGNAVSQLSPAEHIQIFLRCLERHAIRAGEQRGNNQHQQRHLPNHQLHLAGDDRGQGLNWMEMGSDVSSDDGSGGGSRNNSPRGERITPNTAYSRLAKHPIFLRTDASELEELINSIPTSSIATVNAQGSGSGAPLEMDACALDGLMALLDQRARFGELRGKNCNRPKFLAKNLGATTKADL